MICAGGMVSLGKSSVAKILGEHLGSEVFYESVTNNPVLELFYTASEEEIQKNRYPFLLQLYFLNTRFKSIKDALGNDNNVLDRSIYEDWYFAKKNMELGRINDLEFSIYEDLLNNMLEELEELPKKAPDLMIYLKGSFETVLHRIALRGREFELDEGLRDYYYTLWEGYDDWVMNFYKASEVLIIDMDKMDVVNNEEDKKLLLQMVDNKLNEIRILTVESRGVIDMKNKELIMKNMLELWVAQSGFYIERYIDIRKSNDGEYWVSTKEKDYETDFEMTMTYKILINSCEFKIEEI